MKRIKQTKRFLCFLLSFLLISGSPSFTSLAAADDASEVTVEALDQTEEIAEEENDATEVVEDVEEADAVTDAEENEADVVEADEVEADEAEANAEEADAVEADEVEAEEAEANAEEADVVETEEAEANAEEADVVEAEEAEANAEADVVEVDEAEAEEIESYTIISESKKEPAIIATADSDTVAYGTEVNITATVSELYGNVSYQWYMSKDGGATWKKTTLEGNQTNTLHFVASAGLLAYSYRVQVKNQNGIWYSNSVTLQKASKPTITAKPVKPYAFYGNEVVINAYTKNTYGNETFQWYYSTDDGITWKKTQMEGCTTNKLRFVATPALVSYSYRVMVKDSAGYWYSNAVKLEKGEKPVITIACDNEYATTGQTVVIQVTGTENAIGNLSYQWYYSTDKGETWKKTALEGNKSDALIFTATSTLMKYYFRVSVKDENGTWYSDKIRVKNVDHTCSMSVSVAGMNDAEIEEAFVYDWTEKGDLVISWSSKNTTGVYTFDDSLVTMSVSNSGIQSFNYYGIPGLPEETTETSFTIPKETLKTARNISLTIIAKDKNYEFNGYEISKTLYITLPRHVAVLIGNDYSGTSSPLSGTINDVTALKGMLEGLDQNWEVYAFKNQSVNNMKYYMKNIFNSTLDFDTCLFYYSGHGVDGGVGGQYNGALCGQSLNGDYFTMSDLRETLDSCTLGKVIVMLDSCFSGAAINATRGAKSMKSELEEFNKSVINAFEDATYTIPSNGANTKYGGELMVENKYYVITAAARDQTSLDVNLTGGEYAGLFSFFMIQSVGGSYPDGELSNEAPGDVNGDRCLSIGEVKDYAKSCIDEIRADYLATVEEYMDEIMAEWNDNAVIGINAGNPVHVQDVYSSFEEYLQEYYLEGAYDQVTSSYGDDSYIMFRR